MTIFGSHQAIFDRVEEVRILISNKEALENELATRKRMYAANELIFACALVILALGLASAGGANLPAALSLKEAWIGMIAAGVVVIAATVIALWRQKKVLNRLETAVKQQQDAARGKRSENWALFDQAERSHNSAKVAQKTLIKEVVTGE